MDPSTIDRRRFLGLAGAAGALATAPEAAASEPIEDEGLDHTLTVERALLDGTTAPPTASAAGWDPDKLLNQGAATMLWTGRYRRAHPIERDSLEFQEAIDARIDAMIRTTYAMALELDALEGDALAEFERQLVEEPWVAEETRLRFTARALENDMSLGAVRQVDKAFERTLWRVKNQGLAAVKEEWIGRLDKRARRQGIDWRHEARLGARQPFRRPRARKPQRVETGMTYDEAMTMVARQRSTGGWLLGLGIVWMAGPQIIFGGICFGPPMIIVGALKLSRAGKNQREAQMLPGAP